ncbi:histidine kinase [Acinetobacter tianfuensis]|uniref:Histidine kinase n=1 Tax=Acinetobacter tianfuensis TaxID=2419603 RepID=A0A3A8EF95_9GAMM|nr:histidine kinase [Acinetobacter tianfuensis]
MFLALCHTAVCGKCCNFARLCFFDEGAAHKLFIGFCAVLLSLFVVTEVHAQQSAAKCHAELQHIQSAKGAGEAGKSRPEASQWQTIQRLPDYWNERWPKFSGTVWYKLTWQFSCEQEQNQPMMLSISFINMAGQVYINDHFLWQSKSLEEPLSRNWNMPRRWMLPVGVLKSGENTVYIRVEGVSELNPGIGLVHLADYESTMAKFERYWLEMRGLQTYTLCLEVALGVIAAFVWLFRRKETAFGYYALATLLWVVYTAMNLIVEPLFALNTINFARIQGLCFLAYICITCLYNWRFANFSALWAERFLAWLFFAFVLLIAVLPAEYTYAVLQSSFAAGIVIYVLNCIVYPVIAFRSKQPEAYCLAVLIFFIYLPLALHDCFRLYKQEGRLLFVYASPFTTVILASIFALRLTRSMKGVEHFNAKLGRTVEQVRTELSESLNQRHELELNNAKLQERIQLAHDLHDGLGSSLVRSMASIEQSRNDLSNKQFLSVLKHLRDDLRLIVDSGSSLDANVPDTPVLWAAPVRYRFNQLFDELDIAVRWCIPDSWQGNIAVADCISLQRVLEESLTNVLKHSYANSVEVCMKVENEELTISVQDNGVGFDIAAVHDSGLSVGLRSMSARLKKIKAELEVVSQPGCTRVTVRKKNHSFQ